MDNSKELEKSSINLECLRAIMEKSNCSFSEACDELITIVETLKVESSKEDEGDLTKDIRHEPKIWVQFCNGPFGDRCGHPWSKRGRSLTAWTKHTEICAGVTHNFETITI